jgi:hypothetical protein
MSSSAEIEAATAALPPTNQQSLLAWLSDRVATSQGRTESVLDIPAVHLGAMLPCDDRDLLDDMLDDRF